MTEKSPVLLEQRGVAFWITLNRPEKRNAINREVIDGIRQGYHQAHADSAVRVIVLTGAGEKAFCAGADLQPGKSFAFDFSKPAAITPTCCGLRGTPHCRASRG